MAEINDLDQTDASNTARFPENMPLSDVNNGGRALEGILARGLQATVDGVTTTAGTDTAYTLADPRTLGAYYTGLSHMVKWNQASGASPTINVDSLGAKNLLWPDGTAVAAGELPANAFSFIMYDGTQYQVLTLTDSPANFQPSVITTRGDAIRGSSTGAAERLALGADNTVLASDGTDLAFESFLSLMAASISSTQGDITYHNGTNWVNLGPGTSGQFLQTQGAAANPQWATSGMTAGTAQATTSGTTFDFSSLPSGLNRITVMLNGVSLDGTDSLLVQIGDSGGLETTGYTARSANEAGSAAQTATTGYVIYAASAALAWSGHMVLTRIDGNEWVSSHQVVGGSSEVRDGAGTKTLTAELDRLRLLTNGSDNFDAGKVNILYE